MGLVVGKYLVIVLIVAFLVVILIELGAFKGDFIVTTWNMLYLLIGFKDRYQGREFFYQRRIGNLKNCYLVFSMGR